MADLEFDRNPRWLAGPAQDLVSAEFDDDYVVYHRPSGKTHFLNWATGLLLTEVLCVPRDALSAARELAALQGCVGDETFVGAVAQSLAQLESVGLVRRCDG